MQCDECSCWRVSEFSYKELHGKWDELVGATMTPGYKKRYEKEARNLNVPVDEVTLSYKYCLKGKLSRFYIVKHPRDTRACKKVTDCPGFTTATIGVREFPVPSPLWATCMQEAHGACRVNGHKFYPGLREHCYSRIPAHGAIMPSLVNDGRCDICGNDFTRGIVIKEVTQFCCNKHYLQWWKDRHPKLYDKLNRSR